MMFKLDKMSYRAGIVDAVNIVADDDLDLAKKVIEESGIEVGRARPDLLDFIKEHTDLDWSDGGDGT